MRSVVVVLPASICAAIPMLRYLSSGVVRGIVFSYSLPAVVGERAVRVCHLVRVFALLHRVAAIVGGVHEFARQTAGHVLLAAAARGRDDPADRQRAAA